MSGGIKKVVGKIPNSEINQYCVVCPTETRRISYGVNKTVKTSKKDLLKKKTRVKSSKGVSLECVDLQCRLKDNEIQPVYVTRNASTLPENCTNNC